MLKIARMYLICLTLLVFAACAQPSITNYSSLRQIQTKQQALYRAIQKKDPSGLPDDWAKNTSSSELIDFQKKLNAENDEILEAIELIEESSSFQNLWEKNKRIIILLITGRNEKISSPARKKLFSMKDQLDDSKSFLSLIEPTQNVFYLTKKSIAEVSIKDSPKEVDVWPRSMNWKKSLGLQYTITLSYPGEPSLQKSLVYHSGVDQTGWISPEDAATAYANVPYELAQLIPGVRISEFENANGSAGGDGVIDMRSKNLQNFHRTLVHESGHTAWTRKGRKSFSDQDWQVAVNRDGIYPSKYAQSATAEHIAEVGVVYAEAQRSSLRHEYYALYYEQLKLFEKSMID